MSTRTYTLTATEQFDTPEGALDAMLARIGSALVTHETVLVPHYRTGEPEVTHRLVIQPGEMRDTQAHGIAFDCGFLASVA